MPAWTPGNCRTCWRTRRSTAKTIPSTPLRILCYLATRSGYKTSLFCDVQVGQCLDLSCYQSKVEAHIERQIAADPDLVQIENGWRSPKEQKPGAIQRGHFREIETAIENPDAEPAPPCAAAKTAIIVHGKRVGTTITICTDKQLPGTRPKRRQSRLRPSLPLATHPRRGRGVYSGAHHRQPCQPHSLTLAGEPSRAFELCWRKDWQDQEPHLLPAKHLSTWIQTNL